MGKKKPEEMAKQREIFVQGALGRGVPEKTATYIFDLMEKFAGYGFNKSHSAAYALLAYQTAWLKAHYPAPFMAAVLSADMDNTDKVVGLIDECRSLGLTVMPPDVNRSAYRFAATDTQTIVYGLGAIKGVGESAIDTLLRAREGGAEFHSLVDLCQRVDLGKLNKRVLEILIRAGALDRIGPNRATLLATIPLAVGAAEQAGRNAELGVVDLFGEPASAVLPEFETLSEMDEEERLRGEKETLGLYLTGHPIARYREELHCLTGTTLQSLTAQLESRPDNGPSRRRRQDTARIAGLVVGIRLRNTQSGRMAIVTLDDQTGRAEVVLFNEDYRQYQEHLAADTLIVAEGTVALDDYAGGVRMRAQRVLTLDEARAEWARVLDLSLVALRSEQVRSLHQVITQCPSGSCRLRLHYRREDVWVDLQLPEDWQLRPDEQLLRRLNETLGPESRVRLVYGPA